MPIDAYAVHWFRRDLRLVDNPALDYALEKYDGRVLGLFCFDSQFLSRSDFSADRFAFFLATLRDLRHQMQSQGGDLLVLDRPPLDAFSFLVSEARKVRAPSEVGFNRDYEPFARQRDNAVKQLLEEQQVLVHTEADHLLIEPGRILEGLDRGPYQVFSPFQRRWLEVFRQDSLGKILEKRALSYESGAKAVRIAMQWSAIFKDAPQLDRLDEFVDRNERAKRIAIPPVGREAVRRKIEEFGARVKDYSHNRDIPSLRGTSGLSVYFKNGSCTIAEVIGQLKLKPFANKAETGRDKFLSELIWREFYYHILYHYPHVETRAFQSRYDALKWENNETWFEAWKNGKTGYPLVDAGMRQLNQWGWMHNRVRMVVASFLTKDLLIDWRWGERYFMQRLLDGDLAPNNGGWQWAASTGCDPQPYFRIFNPYLQSKKFDAKGDYIRRYVPELKHLDDDKIHEPPPTPGYPAPIVDHGTQRHRALALYNSVVKGESSVGEGSS